MLKSIIKGFMSSDFSEQDIADENLQEFSKKKVSLEDGISLLQGAANRFPKRSIDIADSSSDLIYAARKSLHNEYISVVQENFGKYSREGAALSLLTELSISDAASVFMKLVRTYARKEEISHLYFSAINKQLQYSEIFFPEILEYLDIENFRFEILLFLLTYLQQDALDTQIISKHFSKIEEDYLVLEAKLFTKKEDGGISWIWEDDYQELRSDASLLLDILGYFPDDVSTSHLKNVTLSKAKGLYRRTRDSSVAKTAPSE